MNKHGEKWFIPLYDDSTKQCLLLFDAPKDSDKNPPKIYHRKGRSYIPSVGFVLYTYVEHIIEYYDSKIEPETPLKCELENLPLLDSCLTQCDADQEKEEKKEDDGFGTILLYSDYEEEKEKEEDSESENTQDNVFVELFKKFLGLQGQCIEEDIKDDFSGVMCKRSFGMDCDSHNNQSHPGNGKKLNRPQLEKKLKEFGFSKPGIVTTNGNCLFETLAYLIHYNDINNENRHAKLGYYAHQIRNDICEYLHNLPNDNECLSAIINNEYINTMNTDTVYGTAIEVQAAAELYGYHLTIVFCCLMHQKIQIRIRPKYITGKDARIFPQLALFWTRTLNTLLSIMILK